MKTFLLLAILGAVATTTFAANAEFAPCWSTNDSWSVLVQLPHYSNAHGSEIAWIPYRFHVEARSNSVEEISLIAMAGESLDSQDVYRVEMVVNTQKMVLARIWSIDGLTGARKSPINNPFGDRSWLLEEGVCSQWIGVPDVLIDFPRIPEQRTNAMGTITKDKVRWRDTSKGALSRRVNDESGKFSEQITFDPITNRMTAVLARVTGPSNLGITVTVSWQGGKKWWLSSEALDATSETDLLSSVALLDSDNDGMPDVWEEAQGLNSADPSDGSGDPDNDGLSNVEEFQHGTNPHLLDTDGDGVSDGLEVRQGSDPVDPLSRIVRIEGMVTSYVTNNQNVMVMVVETNLLAATQQGGITLLPPTGGVFSVTNVLAGRYYWIVARYGLLGDPGPWGFYGDAPVAPNGNLGGLNVDIRESASIAGVTRYKGQPQDSVRVRASWTPDHWGLEVADQVDQYDLSRDDGAFCITGVVPNKRYWINAYLDTNTNGTKDANEPWGHLGTNSVLVPTNGLTNVVIDIVDP